jgi:hypothetical protein
MPSAWGGVRSGASGPGSSDGLRQGRPTSTSLHPAATRPADSGASAEHNSQRLTIPDVPALTYSPSAASPSGFLDNSQVATWLSFHTAVLVELAQMTPTAGPGQLLPLPRSPAP